MRNAFLLAALLSATFSPRRNDHLAYFFRVDALNSSARNGRRGGGENTLTLS